MRVSTLFPIAVHSMMVIAVFTQEALVPEPLRNCFPVRRVTSELIAESTGSNPVIIRRILGHLKRVGYVNVACGKGGTTLAVSPKNITLWDVFSAVEATETSEIFRFHTNMSEDCPIGGNIHRVLSGHFDDTVSAMKQELSSVTLSNLLDEFFEALIKAGSGKMENSARSLS